MMENTFMGRLLYCLRVRFHGLKVWREKRIAVLPMIQCHGSTCR
jgi:hypothetical protein